MTAGAPRMIHAPAATRMALLVIAALAGLAFMPRMAPPQVQWSILGAAGLGLVWLGLLVKARKTALQAAIVIRTPHWVQAIAHTSIYLYWGAYVDKVYPQLWLIGVQVVFAYLFDLLMAWSRGRQWVIGFGPIPIVGSTNLFLWFRDELFFLQLAMIALCFLSREFLRWKREGQDIHIFNPSGFGLTVASLGLIFSGSTEWSWGSFIATTLIEAPYMYEWIFTVGILVQFLFGVGLVTMFAALTVFGFGWLWFSVTGEWYFENTHIPVAVFLGMHLLITDPVTSPRSYGGKALFGIAYGMAVFPLYSWLLGINTPSFYDKLLQVPVLNLMVPLFEKLGRHVRVPRWKPDLSPKLFHIGFWIGAFLLIRGPLKAHPGQDPMYWETRCTAGNQRACHNLSTLYQTRCNRGVGPACALMGDMLMTGERGVPQDEGRAVYFYEQACNLQHPRACGMVAIAYEQGRGGLEPSLQKGMQVRIGACKLGDGPSCVEAAARFVDGRGVAPDALKAVGLLETGCSADHAQACGVLAFMLHRGQGIAADPGRARPLYEKACRLGLAPACEQRKAMSP